MTSEVLILNKRAVIVAADSAITATGDGQPRYSKSATKIFDLSFEGSIGAAFFGNAQIDGVPWDVALKLFRSHLGNVTYPRLDDYMRELTEFLSGNDKLFPLTLRESWVDNQFDQAVLRVMKYAHAEDAGVADLSLPLAERQMKWIAAAQSIGDKLDTYGLVASLSQRELDELSLDNTKWVQRVHDQLSIAATLEAVNAAQLASLAHKLRYMRPDALLSNSGLVIAGYGEEDIFPGFSQIVVYGHVGNELCFAPKSAFQISHTQTAMIQPLAQTSMIDMFTDGFGSSLQTIIEGESRKALNRVISDLSTAGIVVPDHLRLQIVEQAQSDFMTDWKRENWKQNYTPLINVLATLDIPEMTHLAESLLGLESLKERVTSPTEEVGGPIDVASITRSEGLVWVKRKHYFDSALNVRYATRVQQATTRRESQ